MPRMYHPNTRRAVTVDAGDVTKMTAWGWVTLADGQQPPAWPSGGGGGGGLDAAAIIADPTVRATFATTPDVRAIDDARIIGQRCEVPTFDGNFSTTHPGVVDFGQPWNGYRYWMAHTPYPPAVRELPSIVASIDGLKWVTPPGLTNPVVSSAEMGSGGYSASSDTELVRDGNTLILYYRNMYGPRNEGILRKISTNGVTWSAPIEVLQQGASAATTPGGSQMLSPTVLKDDDGTWTMWTAYDPQAGTLRIDRRTSADGVTWSAPTQCTIPAGFRPWHLQVRKARGVYRMLVSDHGAFRTYYWTSRDGLTWAGSRAPVLPLSGLAWDRTHHYRAAMVPVAGPATAPQLWDLWVSGINSPNATNAYADGSVWSIGLLRSVDLDKTTVNGSTDAQDLDTVRAYFGLAPYTVGDSFNRPDSTTALGTTTSGRAWAQAFGTGGVIGNKGYMPVNGLALVETDATNMRVDVDITFAGGPRLIARALDSNNRIAVTCVNGVDFQLIKVDGGSTSQLAYKGAVGTAAGRTHRIGLECNGAAITCYVDGVAVLTYTMTAAEVTKYTGAGYTKAGFQADNTGALFDRFTVRAL